MNTLSLSLYSEGSTDNRFLPPIIALTARHILDEYHKKDTAVSEVRTIEVKNKKKRPEAILQAAIIASDYHALIVHDDADNRTADSARIERFEPGFQLVQRTNGNQCNRLLPIIPVQAIEAWMLADHELLLTEIGTNMRPHDLDIPERASQVELIANPKQKLKAVVRMAYSSRPKRRRRSDIDFLYEPIGERISLKRLRQVRSYQRFVDDLTETLTLLGFIDIIHR